MRCLSLVLLALFASFSLPGFAQQGAAPPLAERSADAPNIDRRVTLDVVVTDRAGHPITGLQQQDFTILDDKVPQTILSFLPAENAAVQAILLLDAVNTPPQGIAYQRQQLDKFLRQDGGKLPLPMSIVLLTDTFRGQPAPTRDGNALADSLKSQQSGLRAIGTAQGFYGGVERVRICLYTLQRLTSYETTQPGRKMLIWLGPGWPLLSEPNVGLSTKQQESLFSEVVSDSAALRAARMTLYNVGLLPMNEPLDRKFYFRDFLKGVDSANKVQNGNLAVQVLAVQSGGTVLNTSNDIGASIKTCLADAKAFYTLAFDSPAADHPNEYHSLQIKIDKPGLRTRTRTGYYAQP